MQLTRLVETHHFTKDLSEQYIEDDIYETPVDLAASREIAQRYISVLDFSVHVDALLANPRRQIRLNLGRDLVKYMVNEYSRHENL